MPDSVARVLDRPREQRPDAQAILASAGALTYAELDRRIAAAAGGLWEIGVRPGDRIAASLPNDLDVVIAFHAAMRLGAIWVGIADNLAAPEKYALITQCDPRVLLCVPHGSDTPGTDMSGPTMLEVGPGAADGWTELLAAGHRAPTIDIDPYAPAGIAYTSGTTGAPKGIVHSQHNLLLPGAVLTATRGYGPNLRKGDCLPLTILNMMVLTTLLTAQAGGCCVVMDRRDVDGIICWIRDHGITVWNGVPTQLWDMVRRDDVDPGDLTGVSEIWCGGAGLSDVLREEFEAKFGLSPRATYGLTEVPTVVAMDPPGDAWHAGCSGIALPHLSVGVHDDELTVSAAKSGPWSAQYTPMLGYWDGARLAPTGALIQTGDIGSIDDSGWVRVIDRRKLLIVRGGANVYPTEVEAVIESLPGVTSVAVFGLQDERLGERVAAIIESAAGHLTATELREHCTARLAAYKTPDAWAVVDALPRNAMGKIIRAQLPSVFASARRLDAPADV